LMSTWPGGREATMPSSALLAQLEALGDRGDPVATEEGIRELYRSITAPSFAKKNATILEMAVGFAVQTAAPREGLARQLRAIGRFNAWDRLPELKIPALIVHGDEDPLIPYDNGVLLSRRIPGARLCTLPGVGHLVPLEAPLETYGAILDFLA